MNMGIKNEHGTWNMGIEMIHKNTSVKHNCIENLLEREFLTASKSFGFNTE